MCRRIKGVKSIVALEVRSLADIRSDLARAMKTGIAEPDTRIGFATPELLWQVLTAKRWGLLKALYGAGPVSIRALMEANSCSPW